MGRGEREGRREEERGERGERGAERDGERGGGGREGERGRGGWERKGEGEEEREISNKYVCIFPKPRKTRPIIAEYVAIHIVKCCDVLLDINTPVV